jgi:hypothetical protein
LTYKLLCSFLAVSSNGKDIILDSIDKDVVAIVKLMRVISVDAFHEVGTQASTGLVTSNVEGAHVLHLAFHERFLG